MQDVYSLLGVSPTAPIDEIEAAYLEKSNNIERSQFAEGSPEYAQAQDDAINLEKAFRSAISASFVSHSDSAYTESSLHEVAAPSLIPGKGHVPPHFKPQRPHRRPRFFLLIGILLIALLSLGGYTFLKNSQSESLSAELEESPPLPEHILISADKPLLESSAHTKDMASVPASKDAALSQENTVLQTALLPVVSDDTAPTKIALPSAVSKDTASSLPDAKGFLGHSWGISVKELQKSLPDLTRINPKFQLYSAKETYSAFQTGLDFVVIYEFYKNRLYRITLMAAKDNTAYPVDQIAEELTRTYGLPPSSEAEADKKSPKRTLLWKTEAITAALTYIEGSASSKSSFYADFYSAPLLKEKLEKR